jgi:peptidoglycan/LPS O-acetylase OafA/YrhL
LSLEEQFYLVWPIVLLGALRIAGKKCVLWLSLICATASFSWQSWLWFAGAGGARIYYGSDTRVSALLIGCAMAAMFTGRNRAHGPRFLVGSAVLACLMAGRYGPGTFYYIIAPTLVPIVSAAILWVVCTRGCQWLEFRPLVAIGRRSYGLYLWHYPVVHLLVVWLHPQGALRALSVVAAICLSFALAWISWQCIEQPFLRLKRRQALPANPEEAVKQTGSRLGDLTH